MGNNSDKESSTSSSCKSLNRAHSSPTNKRSLSTSDRHRHKSSSSSTESPRPPSRGTRGGRDSLRKQAIRGTNGRASNPNIKFDQSTLNGTKTVFLTGNQRDLIWGNWDGQKRYDLCRRIYLRAFGKRPEVRRIFDAMGDDGLWQSEIDAFADFLQVIAENLDDFNVVKSLSLDFGRRHGQWRRYGFKSEFWVTLAEATTKECVYLDAAMHPPDEVLGAWSKLVGFIFGWIRDGYYENLRVQRQESRKLTPSCSQSALSKAGQRQRAMSLVEGEDALKSPRVIQRPQSPRLANRRATLCATEGVVTGNARKGMGIY